MKDFALQNLTRGRMLLPGFRVQYADPDKHNYWAETVLLLLFQGANASTVFTDSGPLGKSVTAIGNAQLTTTAPLAGSSSLLLDGTGDALSLVYNANWLDLNSPFTAEWLVLPSVAWHVGGGQALFSNRNGTNGLQFILTGTANRIQVEEVNVTNHWYDYTGGMTVGGTPAVICLERRLDGLFYVYINGVSISTPKDLGTINGNYNSYFGMSTFSSSSPFNGRFGAIRWTKAMRYGKNHTPTPFVVGR